jgi:hypothetical protein
MRFWRVGRPAWLAVSLAAMVGAAAYAQMPWGIREGRFAPRFAPPAMPDGNFTFCRVMYERVRNEPMGMGWVTDYPYAEINLMTRLSELTRTTVSRDERGQPNHWVVRLTDPALFNCPFIMASDAGTIGLTPEEREQLRRYLVKGGFLWVDDFWGTAAWEHWRHTIARILPPAEYPIVDIPVTHPIMRALYDVKDVPQIPSINCWMRECGGDTSERGYDSAKVNFRGIQDSRGRLMVLMSHNTDIADSWEREGESQEYFDRFSPRGYAVGVNVVIYAMTH